MSVSAGDGRLRLGVVVIPVDLGRLREALRVNPDAYPAKDPAFDAAYAVLDAPTVWWCAEHDMPELDHDPSEGHVACPDGSRTAHRDWDCDMRPAVVVPVKGES